ncbi:hypothetical protein C7S14_1076 [Burkholderia cepacia]|nr:hypothetical protein C7S14_1076 [Burkholderia cepacia]
MRGWNGGHALSFRAYCFESRIDDRLRSNRRGAEKAAQ